MKVCNVFEIKTPTKNQVSKIMDLWCPSLKLELKNKLISNYINSDFRKICFIRDLIKKGNNDFIDYLIEPEFQNKFCNEDSKKITKSIFMGNYNIKEHEFFMNETDRTIVALLWHENVPDILINHATPFNFYYKILKNMCFADFIDRITFQNQVWIFNEISSLIKTFYNQYLLKNYCLELNIPINIKEIRFTKILTKYSTEYNNIVFIYNLCQQLQMDKKDVFSLFNEFELKYGDLFFNNNEVITFFEKTEITKLDLKRIFKFLNNNLKFTISTENDIKNNSDTDE
jgi:hypothetical protein